MKKKLSNIGLIGLGVMGKNLALNILDQGFSISIFNRTSLKTKDFIKNINKKYNNNIISTFNLDDFCKSLESPKIIILLIKAGEPTDLIINTLTKYLNQGDIIIDSGNSSWKSYHQREKLLNDKGILLLSSGISGGINGARYGASIMISGNYDAWKKVKNIFEAISAKIDRYTGIQIQSNKYKDNTKISPCAAYIGPKGAGHYVKIIHNGIEYAEMQLICDAYFIMKNMLKYSNEQISSVFSKWNNDKLFNSFLLEITIKVLNKKDELSKKHFVDIILDIAEQKGTGKLTCINALEMNIPIPTIYASVCARLISLMKEERLICSELLNNNNYQIKSNNQNDHDYILESIKSAYLCSKICIYAQSLRLMKTTSDTYNWNIDFKQLFSIWRGGCIIRSMFLNELILLTEKNINISNLLIYDKFIQIFNNNINKWRYIITRCLNLGIPIPAINASITYYDSCTTKILPQNLIQAQRNYFGGHEYCLF